jgi:hypothetical protein
MRGSVVVVVIKLREREVKRKRGREIKRKKGFEKE